jgi:hypothetical protein
MARTWPTGAVMQKKFWLRTAIASAAVRHPLTTALPTGL